MPRSPSSIFSFLLILSVACSSDKNTVTSKIYHNMTAHYNGYFYAKQEVEKIELTIQKGQVDDYNQILKLFPSWDSTLAKGYDKEVQEAVKMASISIQRHPNSKWVDDAYILVGKARMYSMDWGNAIQTFKYVNSKSKDIDAKHRAIINLIRTFIEHKEFNNAQAAIDYVLKELPNKKNLKNLYLQKAYYHQVQQDYDNMVRSLTLATPLLKKKDRPGRIYFIIGQVYQKLGFESEAYNYYRKCLSTNPEYEVDFYARLYMAQVTEITRNRDINSARRSFKKLMKDTKNKEFKDKIYFEMGVFERKQKNIDQAVSDFNLAVREGTNKRIDGEAYLKMGEIYYDTLKNYERSQAYYDSAINSLSKDYEGYAAIKTRAEVLNDFVKNLKIIQWQDSLLSMASLDSAALRARIDSALTAKKNLETKKAGKKKKKNNRIEINAKSNNIFETEGDENQEEAVSWYFGNPSAMSLGQSEFARTWGSISLEDNWRRSQRSSGTSIATRPLSAENTSAKPVAENVEAPKTDPAEAEYARISKELPRTDEQKKEALKKIEDAYFNLGDIYYFKLLEKDNAVTEYKTLLSRFPETKYEPEVLYKLYLIYKELDASQAEHFASLLKTKYPESTYAKILINPDYLQESSQAAEKQKVLYKTAYEDFQKHSYVFSLQTLDQAVALGETSFSANLALLRALNIGQTEDVTKYQYELEQLIKKYPESEVTPYAKKLLDTSRSFKENQEKQKGIQYIRSFEEPHYFVLVYKKDEKISDKALANLDNFNQTFFKDLQLKTASLTLNEQYVLTLVSDLPRISSALEYSKTFNEKLATLTELRSFKFYNFVITKDNFDIFYRTKGLDEYLKFFERNYKTENQ